MAHAKAVHPVESLATTVNECKTTLTNAARTIRGLIKQRDAAVAAAKPADVEAATVAQDKAVAAADLQGGLDLARKDAEAAISEAN